MKYIKLNLKHQFDKANLVLKQNFKKHHTTSEKPRDQSLKSNKLLL